ncbi:MAG: PQQ-dependent sugar dehydrogenase [Vicinamibacterales bacterium]
MASVGLVAVLADGASSQATRPGEPPSTTYGPSPKLPPPKAGEPPGMNFASVIGWKPGETPEAPAGFGVALFAGGLDNPRWLYVLPNGDVLVAESRTEQVGGEIPPAPMAPACGSSRTGLRNPNGMDWAPGTTTLWTVVNERDLLGDDLVPDYLTSVRDGAFYGWPYSYYGQHEDPRQKGARPDLVARAVAPDYALGPHTASLGLRFYRGRAFPEAWRGAFIGQHGSWNRSSFSGYKVIHVPFRDGRPSGPPQDFLTGFIASPTTVRGRPVGVTELPDGSLLVADDAGNSVWRVRKT